MVFDKIKEILAEQLDADADEMTMDTNIARDLGADSLDVVELLMSIEDEFEVEIPDEEIENSFLLELERRVSSDSVIVIDQVEYEVDYRFAKQRIKLRYSPDLKDIFIVETDGTLTPIRLLNKTENAFVKREKVHLCRGEES